VTFCVPHQDCALYISALYLFFVLRNEKHVIILIAQINCVLLMLSLSLVKDIFSIVWSLWYYKIT